jgi:hypothetical protein
MPNDDQTKIDSTEALPRGGEGLLPRLARQSYMTSNPSNYRTPEEKAALDAMWQQYDALRKLGWRDAIYCPKDGSVFLSISAGSTGIHECHYDGEWPKGTWWVHDGGNLWPARPILWKPLPPNTKISHAEERGTETGRSLTALAVANG